MSAKAACDGHITYGCGCRHAFIKGDEIFGDCPKHDHGRPFPEPKVGSKLICSVHKLDDGRVRIAINPDNEFLYDPEYDSDLSRLFDRIEELVGPLPERAEVSDAVIARDLVSGARA